MTAQSATPSLSATRRTETGRKVKALRAQGIMPAVMYGHDKESVALAVNQKAFSTLYQQAGGSTLVSLTVDGDKAVKVLIHDVEINPIRRSAEHADFYIVNLKEKLRTEVPLVFTGVSDAVEIEGGSLITVQDVVEIECFPDDLIPEISVDISSLKTVEDTITIADLVVPEGIVIIDEPDQTLVSVAAQRSEEEMAELDEAPVAEVTTEFTTEDGVKEAEVSEADPKGVSNAAEKKNDE